MKRIILTVLLTLAGFTMASSLSGPTVLRYAQDYGFHSVTCPTSDDRVDYMLCGTVPDHTVFGTMLTLALENEGFYQYTDWKVLNSGFVATMFYDYDTYTVYVAVSPGSGMAVIMGGHL